jgi:hypothetical protein
MTERDDYNFQIWMRQVDACIAAKTGLSSSDLDDYCYRDAFDRGEMAQAVARKAIKNAGNG